ncbi:SCP2 sterol-binding domain-containing protein, partial [Mycobacterium sp. IS-1264]|uniref:SCP2 sterol-binding domain-containing protein n=1 Tax=Mycobacterium sp. IS-1264 TaxID=1834158 RepID=UPI001115816D
AMLRRTGSTRCQPSSLSVYTVRPIGDGPVSPLNGFLAGILLGFDSGAAAGLEATCRIEIDGRRFEFAVTEGRLAGARGEPAVTITASAADLVNARLGSTDAKRKAALRRIDFAGDPGAVDAVRQAFSL